jgi:hypothetical protein
MLWQQVQDQELPHPRMHLHRQSHPFEHPYQTRRQNLTMQVSPLFLIPRTLHLPPSPPLIQLAVPHVRAYVLVDS